MDVILYNGCNYFLFFGYRTNIYLFSILEMKRFLIKIFLFTFPLYAIPIILYLIMDPFKVLYKYNEQVNTGKDYQIVGNRDFQSTQLFLWNYKKYNYDSFILGNSRSMFFQSSSWGKFIKGNIFHFNASSESIYGISSKLKFLDNENVDIKNVLITFDYSTLINIKNSEGHISIKHPITSNESAIKFHYEMFKGFFSSKAFFAYIDLFFTGTKKKYMELLGIQNNAWSHNMKTNQLTYFVCDKQIKNNANLYYAEKKDLFYSRDTIQTYSNQVIN
ncbi:MAG TPA: hypothetical protein VK835_03815, partial [Bacteroidia bacterium]|nr:hypothetical protein [Bacteroidia bacterium]